MGVGEGGHDLPQVKATDLNIGFKVLFLVFATLFFGLLTKRINKWLGIFHTLMMRLKSAH